MESGCAGSGGRGGVRGKPSLGDALGEQARKASPWAAKLPGLPLTEGHRLQGAAGVGLPSQAPGRGDS